MNDHSMFHFLVDEAPTKSVDLELLGEFAKEASTALLGPNRIPLNQTITKIAQTERLKPEQVDIICQEANKTVHAHMFKTADDKYVDFDIANSSQIVSELEGCEKVAHVEDSWSGIDYAVGPSEQAAFQSDFTVTKTAGHAGLYNDEKLKKKATMEKIAHQKIQADEAMILKSAQIEHSENQFIKTARNHMLMEPLHKRRDMFPQVAQFCKAAGMGQERMVELMGLLDTVMVRQGLLEKSADMKADPSLISDNLDARVINGNHPLEILVRTVVKQDKEKALIEERKNLIKTQMDDYNSSGAILGQKVKEL